MPTPIHLLTAAASLFTVTLIAASAAEVGSETPNEQSPRCAFCLPGNVEPTTAETPSPAATTDPAAAGHSITGRVTLSGSQSDPTRAVAYLASTDALDAAPGQPRTAIVAQEHKVFKPSFVAVAKGDTVEFPNYDDYDHNVFSRSAAAPAFDLDRYPKGMSKSRVFDKQGVIRIFCNIHPQMKATVFVAPNRFYAQVDEKGRFEIKGVPPGSYELVVWHQRCGEQRLKIEVKDADSGPVELKLDESREQIMANDAPKRDAGYGIERGLGVKRERLDLPVVTESHPAPKP
jgi:plastocyanin